MRTPYPLFAALIVAGTSGCSYLSQFAYTCGDWLAPGTPVVTATAPPGGLPATGCENCLRSGIPCTHGPPTSGYSVPLAGQGEIVPAGHLAASDGALESNVRDLQQQTARLRTELSDVQRYLSQSQSELIETRAANEQNRKQLQRIETEVGQWGQQLARLQHQIQSQDEQRIRQLQQMDRLMQQMLTQYEPAPTLSDKNHR